MESLWFYVFMAACGGLLLWGLRHPSRVYQYPFLIGAIFSAFLAPQAIALHDNPGGISTEAIAQTFAMGALCMMAAWLGYQLKPARNSLNAAPIYNHKRLRLAVLCIMAISLVATLEMTSIPREEIETGRGPFTILAFFAGLASISFAYFLTAAARRPTYGTVLLALLSGYPIYSAAFFAGRRTETSILFISVALAIFFARRWVLPRAAALAMVIAVAFLIPLFAKVRGEFWTATLHGELLSLDWGSYMNKVLSGEILELRNAAAAIYSTSQTGNYGLGTGYWDAIVFRYVPGQLLGFDVKESLQFHWNVDMYYHIGYTPSKGTTATALADTFDQFDYFGSLFFFLQGYLFKNIWVRALRGSIVAQVGYISLLTPALMGVTHGSKWFVQAGLIVALVLWVMARYGVSWLPKRETPCLTHPDG